MASGRLSKVKGKVVDIPTVPTIGTATAGAESASVAFTASTKGGPVSTYTALSNPGSVTGSGTSSPVTVSGLTAGTAYTFTVRGNNVTGSSEYSSASNSVTPTAATSYESISTTTVGSGGSSSIEFTSIPSTYTHLQVRALTQTNRTTYTIDQFYVQINGVTSSNYSRHELLSSGGNNDTPQSQGTGTQDIILIIPTISNVKANYFGAAVIDFLDYTNTNKYKTARSLGGADSNGDTAGYHTTMALSSGALYLNTNAITSIKMFPSSGTQFNQYTQFALYGIKGS